MAEQNCPVCLLMVGEGATPEAVDEFIGMMRKCIYLSTANASGRLALAAFVLPESKRWWLEGLEENPRLVGLAQAQVTACLASGASSPWSRGEVIFGAGEPPCGACCENCPAYGSPCAGCAASRYSAAGENRPAFEPA